MRGGEYIHAVCDDRYKPEGWFCSEMIMDVKIIVDLLLATIAKIFAAVIPLLAYYCYKPLYMYV